MLTHLFIAFFLAVALVPGAANAQLVDIVLDPIVNEDRTITFRYSAANAKRVSVNAQFLSEPMPLQRGQNGVWSVTVGPVAPEIYEYSFIVNGVNVIDPLNPDVKASLTPSASLVEVPSTDGPPVFWAERNVPHGTLHQHFHHSRVHGDNRGYIVYTPPQYDPTRPDAYPVMYLLHGYTDDEQGWVSGGRANFILDNLIAGEDAVPMVVVMPFGYAPKRAADPSDDWQRWFEATVPRIADYITDELIGLVETGYNVSADPQDRAVVGLSMGGGQTLYLGLGNPDTFTWVCGFSSAVYTSFHGNLITDADRLNQQLNLLWLGCGREDFLYQDHLAFFSLLDEKGVEYTKHLSARGHVWRNWRDYLVVVTPLLFR